MLCYVGSQIKEEALIIAYMPCSLESYFVTKYHKEHSIFQNQCLLQFHNFKLKMENVTMYCVHCFLYSACIISA